MNRCARSGYLVDATSALPDDATDFCVEYLPIVGCSRLRCTRCGADVRNVTGLGFATKADVSRDQLTALYAVKDLASSPLIAPTHRDYRLYVCKCSRWLESSQHACEEPDPDLLTDPQVPWRCSGHPEIALPHDVDGVPLASPDDVRQLAVRGFHGFAPPRTRAKDVERGNWIARLRARLGARERDLVDQVAAASLEDPDPHVRALAVMYAYASEAESVGRRILALLRGDRALFAGIPDDVTPNIADKTLEESMWRALRPLVATDAQTRSEVRSEALSGRAGRSVYSVLAKVDSEWTTANINDLARAAGDRLELLDKSLSQLPAGSPLDALRQRIRETATQPANKQSVANRAKHLADRLRAGSPAVLREPIPGLGAELQVSAGDAQRVLSVVATGRAARELKRGSDIDLAVFLESDVTPDRIRDALREGA